MLAALALAPAALAAGCFGSDKPEEDPSTAPSAAESTATAPEEPEDEDQAAVAAAAEEFRTLAPPELFEDLESCYAPDSGNAVECSGPNVGQLQFSDSETRAAQTAQVLTELRSSTVVEDSGDRLVGWSMLGSTAVLTVVDEAEGQVLQQLISTERTDPRERLAELGLTSPEAAGGDADGSDE